MKVLFHPNAAFTNHDDLEGFLVTDGLHRTNTVPGYPSAVVRDTPLTAETLTAAGFTQDAVTGYWIRQGGESLTQGTVRNFDFNILFRPDSIFIFVAARDVDNDAISIDAFLGASFPVNSSDPLTTLWIRKTITMEGVHIQGLQPSLFSLAAGDQNFHVAVQCDPTGPNGGQQVRILIAQGSSNPFAAYLGDYANGLWSKVVSAPDMIAEGSASAAASAAQARQAAENAAAFALSADQAADQAVEAAQAAMQKAQDTANAVASVNILNKVSV